MKSKRLISMVLVAAMGCTAILSACGGGTAPETTTTPETTTPTTESTTETKPEETPVTAGSQELIYSMTSDAVTMDPVYSTTIPDQKAQALIYEGLTKRALDAEGNLILIPGAAASWDVSEDKTVYTFHLQPEAKWSDGTPVTANDFVYSWQRAFDPKIAGPSSWQLQTMVKNADPIMKGEKPLTDLGVKAVDDTTFEVTLEKEDSNFLTVCGFAFARPVKKELVDSSGSGYGSSVDKIMGNGPFILKTWEPDSKMIYEPNPNYWNKENVHLTKVTNQIIKESSTLAQAMISNEVDISLLNDPDWNAMVEETGYYNIDEVPDMSTEFFVFNSKDPMLSNPKIRLAIALSFDREKYVSEVFMNKYIPAYSLAPMIATVGEEIYTEKVAGKNEVFKAAAQTYPDPKALLLEGMKEAGLGDDPSKLEIHYTTRGTTEIVKKGAEWLKQNIEQTLGINFIIDLTEWNVMYDLIDANNFQIAAASWVVDSGLEPSRFLKLFETVDGYYGGKKTGWEGEKSTQYNELVKQMLEEKDTEKLAQLYLDAEAILAEECPVAPVYYTKTRAVVGKYVQGYQVHPFLFPDYVGVSMTEK